MKRGYADTGEGQIHYLEAGDGPALVLLHPSPQSARVYWRLMPRLAERFRVVAPDTLGFGQSDPLPDGITMERLAASVGEAMDALGIARAHLFGFHTGNKIAAALAANAPARIDQLILCGQTHSLIADQASRIAAFGPITDRYFDSADAEAAADSAALAHMHWASEMSADMARLWWDQRAITEFGVTPALRRYLANRVMDLMQAKPSAAAIYAANFGFDFEAALRRVAAPTLIVEVASAAEEHLGRQADRLAALLANGHAATIEDGDREVLEMRTDEIAGLIEGFFRGVREGE